MITLANEPAPILLMVGPDGALKEPGALDVSGRVLADMSDGQIPFAPATSRCTLGVLRP